MKRLPLALLLLLAPPALAAKGDKATGAQARPATVTSTAPVSADQAAHDAAFKDYTDQLASGQKSRAADALVALLDDPARSAWHAEAYARLGDLFHELSLPYAATIAWSKAFAAVDPAQNATVGGERVATALADAKKVGDLAVLEAPFAKNVGLAQTEDVRGQMAYLAARESVRKESYGVALGILKMVPQGDPLYAEARSLEGIVLSKQGRWEDALKAFEAASAAGRDKDQKFRDLLTLNTARAWYGSGNYPKAILTYALVSRGSPQWPDATFERAWAHFRLDDFNGALGQLLSLDNAFFADFYYPEADQLRIYSMFLMCKLPESEEQIAAFTAKYTPVKSALDGWVSKTPSEAFEAARAFREKGDTSGLPTMILRPWATEERFGASLAAVAGAEDELGRLKNVPANPFSDRARQWVTDRRNELIREEGARVLGRVKAQQADLTQKLMDIRLFTVDVTSLKATWLRMSADKGEMLTAGATPERTERLRKGWREWPYEGEVWADEIGYYRVSTKPECPASLRQSVQ